MIHSTHRFHGRSSLRFVFKQGKLVHGAEVSLRFAANPRQQTYRSAVIVSRKVSKSAVVRNRIRRRVFEIVRRSSGRLAGPYDMLFSVRSAEAATLDHAQLERQIYALLAQAGILRP